jgi:hypothetical protein
MLAWPINDPDSKLDPDDHKADSRQNLTSKRASNTYKKNTKIKNFE